jgi:hypothetical protein
LLIELRRGLEQFAGGGTRPTDFTTTPEGGFLVVVKRQVP